MRFQACYNFISYLILKIFIECPEEIFEKQREFTQAL